jgi:hypothetical protein
MHDEIHVWDNASDERIYTVSLEINMIIAPLFRN